MAPVNVIVYHPKTAVGKEELAKRVAVAHATSVIQQIKSLNQPNHQKQLLVDAIVETVRKRSREQDR